MANPKALVLALALGSASLSAGSLALAQQRADNTVAGNWQPSWEGTFGQARQATIEIRQDGLKLSGTFHLMHGSHPLIGSVQGNKVSFSVGEGRMSLTCAGTINGDRMSGTTQEGALGRRSASRVVPLFHALSSTELRNRPSITAKGATWLVRLTTTGLLAR
jgi:hypothetical protein